MDLSATTLRLARLRDARDLLAIYEPYVRNTCISFELEPPSAEEFRKRMSNVMAYHPYLVAECEGVPIGYCYATFFRPRLGYRPSVETSIYLRQDVRGGGVGRRLYRALGKLLRMQNVYNSYACIAVTDPPTDLTPATSRLFHEKVGYSLVGTFPSCGYKLDNWVDMVWMEKALLEHVEQPEPFIPFPELDPVQIQAVLDSE